MTLASRSLASVLGALAVLAPGLASAQPPLDFEWTEITPSTSRFARSYYGASVAFDGTRFAVGRDGAIDVFRWEDGAPVHEARLEPGPENGAGFGFGHIALSGDRLLAGAPQADGDRGAYFVFQRSAAGTWSRVSREMPPTDACCGSNGGFGSTAADGTRAVVGAPFFDGGFGSVTVLRADASGAFSLARSSRYVSPVGALFGFDPSISGDTVFGGNLGAMHIGSAILMRDTGTALVEVMTIPNPTPAPFDQFGITGELTEDHLYVGARYDDVGGTDAGAVYVFSRAGVLEQTLLGTEPLGRFSDNFDVSGEWMLVGVPAFVKPGVSEPERVSSVVAFRRDASGTWQRRGTVSMFGGEVGAHLGNFVSMVDNVAVVSAPVARVGGADDAGRAWVLTLTEPDGGRCDRDSHCTSGHCADGICCESACDGACESCRASETDDADGVCAPVTDGTDPADECAAAGCGTGTCMSGACATALGCDAGMPDAGPPDAGPRDAGTSDGGAPDEDAGPLADAGRMDDDASIPRDGGPRADTGPRLDGSTPETDAAGVARIPLSCTCRATTSQTSGGALALLALVALALAWRRR